jgi:phage protein D
MPQVPIVTFKVTYNGRDISEDVSRHIISWTYVDNVRGQSDEIELVLEDTDGKWRNEWYPTKGDLMSLQIGLENNLMNCGDFEIDEIALSGVPDVIHIRALASGITKKMRTKNSKANENKTLRQIAQDICSKHGLTLDEGTHLVTKTEQNDEAIAIIDAIRTDLFNAYAFETPEERNETFTAIIPRISALINILKDTGRAELGEFVKRSFNVTVHANATSAGIRALNKVLLRDVRNVLVNSNNKKESKTVANNLGAITIERSTQNRETDLEYLARIAADYGFAFNIKGKIMLFYNIYNLENQRVATTLFRSQLMKYDIKDTTHKTFKTGKLKHHHPTKKEVIEASAGLEPMINEEGEGETPIAAEDSLEIKARAENKQQAEAKIKSHLHKKNSKAVSGNLEVDLNVLLVAGNNFKLADLGVLSGTYHILKSTHKGDKAGGGTTDVEIKRVGTSIAAEKKLPPAIQIAPKTGATTRTI